MRKLRELVPMEGESMERFLIRCHKHRREWSDFDLECPDADLIQQIHESLTLDWWKDAGLHGLLPSDLDFDTVCEVLQDQDTLRRQDHRAKFYQRMG